MNTFQCQLAAPTNSTNQFYSYDNIPGFYKILSTAQLTLPLVLFTSGACKLVLFIFPRGPVRWQAMTIVISFEIVYYLAPSIFFKICTIFKTLSLGSCGQYCTCIARSFCGNKLIGWETRQFIKKIRLEFIFSLRYM